jgi:four helix bundle protein
MERQKPHKGLKLWSEVMNLVVYLYEVSKSFPREEEFGLKSQIRRAAVSVPSNISEGLTRKSPKDRYHFLNIAQGSLSEIDAQIEIAERLGYIDASVGKQSNESLAIVERLLSGLMRSVMAHSA